MNPASRFAIKGLYRVLQSGACGCRQRRGGTSTPRFRT